MGLYKIETTGTVFEVVNDTELYRDVLYASVTAPALSYIEVLVDDEPFDGVWVAPGSSHSWWSNAGGKILPANGLAPGKTLKITASGPCCLRVDWVE